MKQANQRRVQAVVALKLLEVIRDRDLPGELLEDEDPTVTIPRRFGLNEVVERQIRTFREEARRGGKLSDREIGDLFRLVIRRPDANEVFHELGRLLAGDDAPSRWPRALPSKTRFTVARSRAGKRLRKLFGRPVGRFEGGEFVLEAREHFLIDNDPGGAACHLVSGLCEQVLAHTLGGAPVVKHVECRSRGTELCRWEGLLETPPATVDLADEALGDEAIDGGPLGEVWVVESRTEEPPADEGPAEVAADRAVEEPPTETEGPAMEAEEPAVEAEELAVAVEEPAGTAEPPAMPAAPVQEAAGVAAEGTGATVDDLPATAAEPPSIADEAPTVAAGPPAVDEEPPAIAEGAPTAAGEWPGIANEPSFIADEASSTDEEPPVISEERPFLAGEPHAIAEEASAMVDTPPAIAETPPAIADEPPAIAEERPSSAEEPEAIADDASGMVDRPPAIAEELPAAPEAPYVPPDEPPRPTDVRPRPTAVPPDEPPRPDDVRPRPTAVPPVPTGRPTPPLAEEQLDLTAALEVEADDDRGDEDGRDLDGAGVLVRDASDERDGDPDDPGRMA